jgi:hypothetical protein
VKLIPYTEPFDVKGCRVYFKSADDYWFIGTKPVIFGMRVVAWRDGSAGPVVDYCAGDNPPFLSQLLVTVATIFNRRLPDGASEREVLALMPTWQRRPIDGDPCWPALKALAAEVPA